jgi:hypothetical protein
METGNEISHFAAQSEGIRELVVLHRIHELADIPVKPCPQSRSKPPHHAEVAMPRPETFEVSLYRIAALSPRIVAQSQKSIVRG